MTTPTEHDALAQVRHQVLFLLPYQLTGHQVDDVIQALRQLAADPGTRPAVLVALGLTTESPSPCRCGHTAHEGGCGECGCGVYIPLGVAG